MAKARPGEDPTRINAAGVPLLAGALLCVLTGILWWTLDQREKANLSGKIQSEARYLASQMDVDLHNRILSLQRTTRNWERRGGIPKEEFNESASAYLSDAPGFQALGWVDKDYFLRWVIPMTGNERTVDFNLSSEHKRRTALERARMTRSPTMTAPMDLVQGGKGFAVYFPLNKQGESGGFILAVFRIQKWLTYVFNGEKQHKGSDDYRIKVFIDGIPVYEQDGWEGLAGRAMDAVARTRIMDHDVAIHIRPVDAFVEKNHTLLPALTAIFGILLSLLVTAVVYLFRKTSMESRAARNTQRSLEDKERNLKAIFESSPVGMLVLDEETSIIMANGAVMKTATGSTSDLLYRQPGDVLSCIHSSEDPRGCGYSPYCPLCPLRNAMMSVISHGVSLRNVELAVDVVHEGTGKTVWLELGAEPFIIKDRRMAVVALHEITVRKQAEEALKRSEEQVRLLLNSTGEAIYGIDLVGNCTFANPACLRMLGYTSMDQLLGKNMHQLIHHSYPDGSPMDVEDCRIYRAFHQGNPSHVEDEVLWKADATSFPVEYWSYPQIIDGEICGAVVTFLDITERKHVAASLQQRESYLTAIIENQPGLVWLKDTESRFLAVNQAFAVSCGRQNPEDLVGKTDFDIWPRDLAEQYRRDDLLTIQTGKPTIVEEPILDKRGTRWFETFKTPVLDGQNNIIGTTGYARDITERKKAQEALTVERQRLASILEGTNVGTWEWNVQTGEIAFNERWAGIIGYSLAELAPISIDTWLRYAHPDDLEVSNILLERHFARELPYYECEIRMQHKEGSWVWVLDRGKVASWTTDGKPLLMSGTHQDITKRKRAEEQLAELNLTLQQRIDNAVAELREKDQVLIQQGRLAAMGEMIGNIAHQWRQPLNALSMLITNLHFAWRDGELTEVYMDESAASANRLIQKMSTTINDFRNFFSPDKEMTRFSALEQISHAVLLVSAAFRNSRIEIAVDEGTDCTMLGYPNEYSQVLLNVLTNAREAITQTESFPGLISITVRRENRMGVVAVRDNGGGIPGNVLEKIFEPYFTTKPKGTGIGLYMSKVIIERNMQGLLSARNVKGGSEFTISVPLAEESAR